MYNFPDNEEKKTILNINEPTIDGGYRPWGVDWRDKYIYGTIKKSWEEMTPQERMEELDAKEFSRKFGVDYQQISKNRSRRFDFVDWLILAIFLLGIACMVCTYTLGF